MTRLSSRDGEILPNGGLVLRLVERVFRGRLPVCGAHSEHFICAQKFPDRRFSTSVQPIYADASFQAEQDNLMPAPWVEKQLGSRSPYSGSGMNRR